MLRFGRNRKIQTHMLLLLLSVAAFLKDAVVSAQQVRINEVSDKGSDGACNGEDWLELYYAEKNIAETLNSTMALDLVGYVLHDDNGPEGAEAFTFPGSVTMIRGEFLLLCSGGGGGGTDGVDSSAAVTPLSFQFGIGGSDQVTLRDPSGAVVSTTGASMDGRGDFGVTLAYDDTSETYLYTITATPGAANVITEIPEPETMEDMKARLSAQNAEGTAFFNFDDAGLPVDGGFPAVVDLRMEMEPSMKAKISGDERGFEVYSPFLSVRVTAFDDPSDVLLNLTNPGRIRPKGQSTMYIGVCSNKTTPYLVDLEYSDPSQKLFGAGRVYLRSGWGDPSFVREWAAHRMLAMFGLPHLRTRTVRFFINDESYGLYNLMEAPDQDYVFHRSFPDFDPEHYGLYKVKTLSLGCGRYDESSLAKAEARIGDSSTPPYVFERGEHRPKPPVLESEEQCFGPFVEMLIVNETADAQLAYVRSGAGKCGDFLVEQGLIDRDLGDSFVDAKAAAFIDAHLADNMCDDKCANSNLADDVNVTQFLRNHAFMAALLHMDSPLGNGNNYYLANPGVGGEDKWSMVQYDHNGILSSLAGVLCDSQQCGNVVNWSILRPTCRSLETSQMAGPLLTDDTLRAQYVEHVREFTEDVMTDEGLLLQIRDHLVAIKDLVAVDPWNDYASVFETYELAEGKDWNVTIAGFPYSPFLPLLRARAAEIQKQLAALDSGTYPRGVDEYNPGEACVDWTTESPPDFACHNNCYYEGCTPGNIVEQSFCDPESGTCFKGMLDFQCLGVPDGDPVPGITPASDADPSYCLTFESFPIKATTCPPYVEVTDDKNSNSSGENVGSTRGGDQSSSSGGSVNERSRSSSLSSNSALPLLVLVAASQLILASVL